ncbi:MAG TPA: hypothetical protein VK025_15765 [Steroidobacter sp.]|jgi:hypothetical protein|nr:hypothetical protein [Steroidobacteraceae bacterium]HLS82857.1 hypothetical protein [Steroidobacter sp.]
MQTNKAAALRLKAIADADSGSLVRALQLFQMRNVTPLRVAAQRIGREILELEIEVDPTHLTPEAFRTIVGKLNELPVVWSAVACD